MMLEDHQELAADRQPGTNLLHDIIMSRQDLDTIVQQHGVEGLRKLHLAIGPLVAPYLQLAVPVSQIAIDVVNYILLYFLFRVVIAGHPFGPREHTLDRR